MTGEQGKVSKAIELDRNLDCQPILPIHKSWTLFNNNSLLSVRKHLILFNNLNFVLFNVYNRGNNLTLTHQYVRQSCKRKTDYLTLDDNKKILS